MVDYNNNFDKETLNNISDQIVFLDDGVSFSLNEVFEVFQRLKIGPDTLIVDPFAGAGITGIAAALVQNPALLVELDSTAVKRIQHNINMLSNPNTSVKYFQANSFEIGTILRIQEEVRGASSVAVVTSPPFTFHWGGNPHFALHGYSKYFENLLALLTLIGDASRNISYAMLIGDDVQRSPIKDDTDKIIPFANNLKTLLFDQHEGFGYFQLVEQFYYDLNGTGPLEAQLNKQWITFRPAPVSSSP